MVERDITATYLIETAYPLEKAAEIMAGEQSCGTFLRTPGETDELRDHHSAKVESIEKVGAVDRPTLLGARRPKEARAISQAKVTLSWPIENMGVNLSNLVATIAGNLFELAPFSGIKLLDFTLPGIFAEKYPGPKFGIEGTRKLTNVFGRPIIGTIIKPSVGLTPEQTAIQTKILIEAGLDFLKDDELMGDSPHSPFEQRVDLVMDVINRFADRTGKKPMFAFNISGDMDDMFRRHDYLVSRGGTCVMANINWVGISGAIELSRRSTLPIHGHRNGWGMFNRCSVLGMEFPAYQKIWRLAGIDHMHTNGIRNKFCESDESVIASIKSCLEPFIGTLCPMPVLSSGQWAGQTVDTYQAIQSSDLMYVCGAGIVSHPGGIDQGVSSIIEAWEAAMKGIKLSDYAADHQALSQALDFYEGKL